MLYQLLYDSWRGGGKGKEGDIMYQPVPTEQLHVPTSIYTVLLTVASITVAACQYKIINNMQCVSRKSLTDVNKSQVPTQFVECIVPSTMCIPHS